MYKIFYSTTKNMRTQIKNDFRSFGICKGELNNIFNDLMWRGYVCEWLNNISFRGNINGIETTFFIKKVQD